jgi:hypothetical protein
MLRAETQTGFPLFGLFESALQQVYPPADEKIAER